MVNPETWLMFRTKPRNPEKVKQGMKAAIHNPNVSEGKKDELRHKLEDQF
ncbi:hypothetical protein VP01_1223g6 [Puccinia sorghi]|uniref:Uncharacterized protein n=1 Tax=Puccinia sorghi TaxID=27349 RepID=A0A0L6VQ02_9BASI|nr:hypothetical protein VP01_1223g6 [Puccinia sorghi]